jgi:hypothetical protein
MVISNKIYLCVLILLLTTINVNGQESPKKKVNFQFYNGLSLGFSNITSKYDYNPSYTELINGGQLSNEKRINIRTSFGIILNQKHDFAISVQNMPIRVGYAIDYSPLILVSSKLTKGGIYTNIGYRYNIKLNQNFCIGLGPHIGIVFAGTSDFGSFETGTFQKTDLISGNTNTLVVDREEVRLHQKILNFGSRLNFTYNISEHFDLSLSHNLNYTPYNIRGVKVTYQLNNNEVKSTTAFTNILIHAISLEFKYKF